MYNYIVISLFLMLSTGVDNPNVYDYPSDDFKDMMLYKVNNLRAEGCYCGGEYMSPAGKVVWDDILYKSALSHATEMKRKNFFSHFSASGQDIGDRLDGFGYTWQVAGENLGEGQRSFREVFYDWIDSPSHCRMLMNPKVEEMGVARYSKYWVQHFGKKLPDGTRRSKRK